VSNVHQLKTVVENQSKQVGTDAISEKNLTLSLLFSWPQRTKRFGSSGCRYSYLLIENAPDSWSLD
jgi:hypothetical protein